MRPALALWSILVLGIMSPAWAQDMIHYRDGRQMEVKVIEIGQHDVKFNRWDNLEGPVYIEPRTAIQRIVYQNGTEDIFLAGDQQLPDVIGDDYVLAPPHDDISWKLKGQRDAVRYYRKYRMAGISTFLVTALSPAGGLVTAIGCSSSPPKDHNLGAPVPEHLHNASYKEGYVNEAHQMKKRKVWLNFGIVVAAYAVLIVAIAAQ